MSKRLFYIYLLIYLLIFCFLVSSYSIAGETRKLYLKRAMGDLEIYGLAADSTYEAYFHVPIAFENQVPIYLEVKSNDLIDYRFVHLNPPNLLVAARLRRNTEVTELNWNAWVIIKERTQADIPHSAEIPTIEQLPDTIKKWLQPSACVQINEPLIINLADQLRGNTSNLMALASTIHEYCARSIPFGFAHEPFTLDAFYALTWGSSCTGHSHAASALFRANGIPSRNLLNILTWIEGPFDMHWFNDYYVPDYGWLQMDPTSMFMFNCLPQDAVIIHACHPEDEFPLFFTRAIEGRWHSSDPALGTPDWGRAHFAYNNIAVLDSIKKIDFAISLAKEVFFNYTKVCGIKLDDKNQQLFNNAFKQQTAAFYNMRGRNLDALISEMQEALQQYNQISLEPTIDIYFDDFETEQTSWKHGGDANEWELGIPSIGPENVKSGLNCWGTDLDDNYENNASNWLQSPWIDLTNMNSAFLRFWIWNRVDDVNFYRSDYLWLDMSTNGIEFFPLCSQIIGGHDDEAIPDVPGWNNVTLDLTKYTGKYITFRFRFESDETRVQPGSYIDDVRVYGRKNTFVTVEENKHKISQVYTLLQNYPNPFNSRTQIEYEIGEPGFITITIVNQLGEEIAVIEESYKQAGRHMTRWIPSGDISSGVYFYIIKTNRADLVKKCLYLK